MTLLADQIVDRLKSANQRLASKHQFENLPGQNIFKLWYFREKVEIQYREKELRMNKVNQVGFK